MLNFARVLIVSLSFALAACSSPNSPAPVSKAGNYTAKTKGVIKSAQYTVKKGDTLYSIAWRADIDHKTLAKRNNIAAPYTIFVGQRLHLTQPVNTSSAAKSTKHKNSNSQQNSKKNPTKKLESSSTKAYAENSSSAQKPKPSGKITWVWPTTGSVVKGFSNTANGNKGLDIKGLEGQKIVAAASGRVVYAGSALRGYGKLIIIKHDDDYLSAYAHNSRLRVTEKQQVTVGQHIADMGDTGTTDTRLHFEIRYQGKSVDPMTFLPAR